MPVLVIFKVIVKSLSFGKIPKYHQNLWDISANVNNYFGLFATHSFKKFSTQILCVYSMQNG